MISNSEIYYSIAKDAHEEMRRLEAAARQPKPDGSPGSIVKLDPERTSYKQALVASAFAAICFEALVYREAKARSNNRAKIVNGTKSYRGKLEALGIRDEDVLQKAEVFQSDRRDLMHEKALHIHELNWSEAKFAQVCADEGIAFLELVRAALAAAR